MSMEEELKDEIEIARHALEGDIERNTRKAEENLEKILSRGDMEFCSRCGRKVEGRMDWAGKCMKRGCRNLLCADCWVARKRRFCMEHYRQMAKGKPEEKAREKVFFKEDSEGIRDAVRPELGGLKEGGEEQARRERAESLARGYANFLDARFRSEGAIDFSPEGFFKGPRAEAKPRDDEVWIRVFRKGFLRSRDVLRIVIKPIYSENAGYLVSRLRDALKGEKGYPVIVLVGEKSPSSVISFVNGFGEDGVSLFLAEPGRGLVYFNDSIPMNRLYSSWLERSKNPLRFREILQSISERVSERWVVSAGKVSGAFGYTNRKAREVLKGCGFLSPVPDTDQFLFGKEK